jgi:hypothetical protein
MQAFDPHIRNNSKHYIGRKVTLRQKWNWHVILDSSENSSITNGKDKLILAQQ